MSLKQAKISFVISMIAMISISAEEAPPPVKEGGLPYDELWNDSDVEKYLDFPNKKDNPNPPSAGDLFKLFEEKQKIGDYHVVKDSMELKTNAFTFRVTDEDSSTFAVCIYDHQKWDQVRTSLIEGTKDTVQLWNKIPEFYTVEKGEDKYSLTHKASNPGKWQIDLVKVYMINVQSEFKEGSSGDQASRLTHINNIIQGITSIVQKGPNP